MVKKKLVAELIDDGAKLLRELDRLSFPVEAMFWLHLAEEDYWRLVIASTLVHDLGGGAVYRRLDEELRKIELSGTTLEDISLVDPQSAQHRSLLAQAGSSGRLASGPEWLEFEEAIVYRWTGESIRAELTPEVNPEELAQLWDAERRISNRPALLITSDNGRVTLRFHPQHGPLRGIGDIRTAFQIALHRPNALPKCTVSWLD
jgi:hypothetical protein